MILDKALSKSLLGYNPINKQIMTVRSAASLHNLSIVQGYAPTNVATDSEKDAFNRQLEQVTNQLPARDIIILSGNWNAKLGKGNPIGKHALGTMNDNGERLLNYARINSVLATNCLVPRHARRTYTWKSFDGAYRGVS